MDYYDIDDILAEEERVPCVFQQAASGLGFVDPHHDDADLPSGHSCNLPWWLANKLASYNVVGITTPRFLSVKARDGLQADPCCVPLRDKSPYFYELCEALGEFLVDPGLLPLLAQVFTKRMTLVLQHALTFDQGQGTAFHDSLTNFEQKLLRQGQVATKAYMVWKQRPKRTLASSELVRAAKRVRTVA